MPETVATHKHPRLESVARAAEFWLGQEPPLTTEEIEAQARRRDLSLWAVKRTLNTLLDRSAYDGLDDLERAVGVQRGSLKTFFSYGSRMLPEEPLMERILSALGATADDEALCESLYRKPGQMHGEGRRLAAARFVQAAMTMVGEDHARESLPVALKGIRDGASFMQALRALKEASGLGYRPIAERMQRRNSQNAWKRSTLCEVFKGDTMPPYGKAAHVRNLLDVLCEAAGRRKEAEAYYRVFLTLHKVPDSAAQPEAPSVSSESRKEEPEVAPAEIPVCAAGPNWRALFILTNLVWLLLAAVTGVVLWSM